MLCDTYMAWLVFFNPTYFVILISCGVCFSFFVSVLHFSLPCFVCLPVTPDAVCRFVRAVAWQHRRAVCRHCSLNAIDGSAGTHARRLWESLATAVPSRTEQCEVNCRVLSGYKIWMFNNDNTGNTWRKNNYCEITNRASYVIWVR